MKKILAVFAGLLGLMVIGVLVKAALQSPNYTFSRELQMAVAPPQIFEWINNSQKSQEWMPWAESDPGVKMNYSGPTEGVGSISSWASDGSMGVGEAKIIESNPFVSVKTQLTYTKPFAMQQIAEISLAANDQGTLVKWTVSGENNFMGRVMCAFMNMDKIVGTQFDNGLAKLKNIVEKKP